MIPELGHFALALALVAALFQFVVPLYGFRVNDRALMATAAPASLVQVALVALAFAALMWSYIVSDFSVENVYQNSHSAKPLLYKISGVWGNHEGSMVLWVLILAVFGAAVGLMGRNLPDGLRALVLSVQASISVAFLMFLLFTSNPFVRLPEVPIEGNGLNPLLQDPALAFHPPFLYGGYVGLSVSFAFAIAALIEGRVDAAWARWVRPWTRAAWMSLTLGIAMGSWWAYYELGWGGWWFWDPVENASLMPWLAATALLHSAIVVEKRNALKIWTIFLAILAFSLSLVGTFLVRSGVLTSVHAFAVDPERGVFILMILCVFIGGSFVLYAWRAASLHAGGLFAPISREGALVVNNLLLSAATAAVFIGTLYPLLLESINGEKISVGPPYFNLTFGPLMMPLLLLVPIGPMLSWKRAELWPVVQRLWWAALVAVAVALAFLVAYQRGPWLAPVLIAVGAWIIAGAIADLAFRAQVGRVPASVAWARLSGLPRAAFGGALAHAGVGVLMIGIVGVSFWKDEKVLSMTPGQSFTVGGVDVKFLGERPLFGPNFTGIKGEFEVSENGAPLAVLRSEKREFLPSRQPTTEVGLLHRPTGDVYVVMGDTNASGQRTVRGYFHPLVSLLWIGSAMMFFGGALSLTDRRFRVGAPRPARAGVQVAGAGT
jgi:cytochrome c-type biogenesis protein CcmF